MGDWGDLNEILWDYEKAGGSMRDQCLIQNFRDMMDDCRLRDLGFNGGIFTWCNRRQHGDQVSLRLDRFLANSGFLALWLEYQVTNQNWAKSDHKSIELCVQGSDGGFREKRWVKPFRFEECWTQDEKCRNIILNTRNWLDKDDRNSFLHQKLQNCASILGRWGKRKFGERREQIRKVKDMIKE